MSGLCDTIERMYNQIWKDIWASGECPISVIPLNVHATKYGKSN